MSTPKTMHLAALFLVSLISTGARGADGLSAGGKAPAFTLSVLGADSTVRLLDLVGGRPKTPARLVLVSFFATWCKPCKEELPVLQAIHETLGPQGVRVLSVVVEGGDERPQEEILAEVAACAKAGGVTFPILYDPYLKDVVAKRYLGRSMELPGVYLVAADGRIRAVWHEKREDLPELVREQMK